MRVKIVFITLGIIAGILAGIALCVVVFFPITSDAELLENLFPADFPGYSNLEVLSSEGEGIYRVPRRIEIIVQLESYPHTVSCPGEVFLWPGDPMGLNVRWRTLQCAGQHRYMELAQIALENGFGYEKCHNEKTALLLARWVKSGLISMDEIMFPAVNERVAVLVADPELLTRQAARDGGLFDTADIIVRHDVKSENGAGQSSSIVLRCSGRVELFPINPGLIHQYADIPGGDYLMPDTLEPFTPLSEE